MNRVIPNQFPTTPVVATPWWGHTKFNGMIIAEENHINKIGYTDIDTVWISKEDMVQLGEMTEAEWGFTSEISDIGIHDFDVNGDPVLYASLVVNDTIYYPIQCGWCFYTVDGVESREWHRDWAYDVAHTMLALHNMD